jgi:hypothetical protein
MFWERDACYRITYGERTVTFKIVGELPLATHKIRIRDLKTDKESFLFDLLLTTWTGFERIKCPDPVTVTTVRLP